MKPIELKMKEIMESLSADGRFHYAPGLTFLEEKLSPQKYKVEQDQKRSAVLTSIVTRITAE